jgi:hypothetical protein
VDKGGNEPEKLMSNNVPLRTINRGYLTALDIVSTVSYPDPPIFTSNLTPHALKYMSMLSFSLCRGLAKWSLPVMKLYGLHAPLYSKCPHCFTTKTVAFGKQIVLCSSSWCSCMLFCFRCFLSCLLISSSESCCHFTCYVQTSSEHPVVVSFPYT